MKTLSPALKAYFNRVLPREILASSPASGVLGQGELGEMALGTAATVESTTMATARGQRLLIAPSCYTLTLTNGMVLRYTDADIDVEVSCADVTSGVLGQGNLGEMALGAAGTGSTVTYVANSIMIEGLKFSISAGLEVDEQEITVKARPTDTILGVPFMAAARNLVLDEATLDWHRAYLPAWGSPAIGAVHLFHGRVADISDLGGLQATIKVKSDLVLLDIQMPRNLYQAACLNTFCDALCGLNKADFTAAGTATGGDARTVQWAGATSGIYDQGTMTFLTGANAGEVVSVRASTGTAIVLVVPLQYPIAAGDTFSIIRGCDHTLGAGGCGGYANTAKFRGFPYVPPPETAT